MSAVAEQRESARLARLKITEIFLSLQGESTLVGLPTVFIRLTGCPLRCQYCDTAYAFHGGEWMSLDGILEQVTTFDVKRVCVTGGEPLAQKSCFDLLSKLCDAGYAVSLETSGAIDVSKVDPRVVRVLDIKTPGSGEVARNLWSNLDALHPHDEIKFVICDRADYEWSRDVVAKHALANRCTVLFSPSHEQIAARDLAEWVVQDRLPVRMQVQLHKILWGGAPGR
ncbi:MAG TPA: 7-carboxy-7-deazaguanine synthase QueE [Nevskiaceae bacterium]|nr:7-carboxy-7-deazaguanine synthase QueE [Nevskiaceae bacterium]